MLFGIDELLNGKPAPVTIERTRKVKDAVSIMVQNDFSQLPVVNADGSLVGMVSEQSITRVLSSFGENPNVLELNVDHCQFDVPRVTKDQSISDVLLLLRDTFAVLVVKNDRPIGIITNHDMVNFYKEFSEALIDIQDIELTLRGLLLSVFSTEEVQIEAARKSGGGLKKISDWDFGIYEKIILNDEHWEKYFSRVFEPKVVAEKILSRSRKLRNKQAHFAEGKSIQQLNQEDKNFLNYVKHWLDTRPKLLIETSTSIKITEIPIEIKEISIKENKYFRLRKFLESLRFSEINLSFDLMNELVGGLPPSAIAHRSWWANDSVGHSQSKEWLKAKWRVKDIDFENREVFFMRLGSSVDEV